MLADGKAVSQRAHAIERIPIRQGLHPSCSRPDDPINHIQVHAAWGVSQAGDTERASQQRPARVTEPVVPIRFAVNRLRRISSRWGRDRAKVHKLARERRRKRFDAERQAIMLTTKRLVCHNRGGVKDSTCVSRGLYSPDLKVTVAGAK